MAVALLIAAAPANAQSVPGAVPDYFSSDNVERVGNVRTVGDGVGATIVGNYMYVTSTLSLSIFDITDAENPVQVGITTLDVEFENEEVPTNGKILGISGQIGCKDPSAVNGPGAGSNATGCLSLYDVRNPAAPTYIKSVPAGEHTHACVLDCTYFYGSSGSIVDARVPAEAKKVGNWKTGLEEVLKGSCHHVREIKPGYILGSCQPLLLLSVLPEDGGSPEKPALIATGNNTDERFQHSSRWPRGGADKFMLSGGETNAAPQCDDEVGAFMVWDTRNVISPVGFTKGSQFTMLSEYRPQNGNFVDGWSPANGLGCSVHWFQEHPTFRGGGLVAVAAYENGTRLLQIQPNGKIVEQGWFLPVGGSASAPHWHPGGKVFYTIDYARGFDVVRYTGDTYVPADSGDVVPTPGATPGSGGAQGSDGAPCARAAGFDSVRASGRSKGLRFTVAKRQDRSFDVHVYQQSSGRNAYGKNALRAKFLGRTKSFNWSGGKKLGNGFYYVTFTMRLDGKVRDVRRVTLERRGGEFRVAPDFAQRSDCGPFERFALSSSVFGGRTSKKLGISYKLAKGADKVMLVATVGSKRIKAWTGRGEAGKTYRFSLPASKVKKGQRVKITAQVEAGSPQSPQMLFAKRL